MDETTELFNRFLVKQPRLGAGVYIARGAVVVGDVTLGEGSSVWYNAVLRGDINRIEVGRQTNIQDNVVIHLSTDLPVLIGNRVTIGHSAVVHACTIQDETLIGIGAVVLDGAEIGRQCLVGARALVTPRTKIPDGSLVLGAPAKVVRRLNEEEKTYLRKATDHYVQNAAFCLAQGINVGEPLQP